MPHAAHFICGDKCRFHLATYVGGYIVSTVGEYWPERNAREIHAKIYDEEWLRDNKHLKGDTFDHAYFKRFGYEQIGCDRLYETMVFRAKSAAGECCPWQIDSGHNEDFKGYNDASEAFKGHMAMCKKWSETFPSNQ